MEKNAVAAFLLMLRNFLQGHPVNQESLVHCQGPAIIGALLRKVRPAGAGGASFDQGAVGWRDKAGAPDAISQGGPPGRGGI